MKIVLEKTYISKSIMIIIFIAIVLNIFQLEIDKNNIDILVLLTFIIIFIISIYNIFKDKTPYSLNKTFWYYNLIFNFIAPLIQYLTDYREWGYILNNDDYLNTNILIIFSLIIYLLFYRRVNKKMIIKQEETSFEFSKLIKVFLVILSITCLIIGIRNVGFSNLFSRSENNYAISEDGMFNTIFTHIIKCIPVYTFVLLYMKDKKLNIINIFLIFTIIILNFPTSTTRFWMGAIYIGIFLLIFNKNIKNNRRFDLLIMFTFTIIFSIMYSFKFHDIDYFIKNGIEVKDLTESYNSVDYDAYSIIARGLKYVENNDYVYGKQVVGTIFFMIPRSIWNNKPTPTGELIANAQGQSYTNISCPYIMEGYINFGILGVIIFQIVLSMIFCRLDKEYWSKRNCNKYIKIIYPFLMGFVFYLERGALHPVVVYLFCFCIPLIFMCFIDKFKKLNKGELTEKSE